MGVYWGDGVGGIKVKWRGFNWFCLKSGFRWISLRFRSFSLILISNNFSKVKTMLQALKHRVKELKDEDAGNENPQEDERADAPEEDDADEVRS